MGRHPRQLLPTERTGRYRVQFPEFHKAGPRSAGVNLWNNLGPASITLERYTYMYCRCGKQYTVGYTAARQIDATDPYDFNYDFWVCANCHKPSLLVLKGLTHMLIPKRATGLLGIHGLEDGTSILTWSTEVSGERIKTMTYEPYLRKVDMTDHGRGHLVEFWKELDECIDSIRSDAQPSDIVVEDKVRATTYAQVLAQLMQPFYADHNAVLAESMNRWKARQDGRDHETPGLAESIWDPSTRFDGTPYSRENEQKVRAGGTVKSRVKPLDDQKVAFVNHCLQAGSMDAEQLAAMFSCSVDDIKAVVK